MLAHSEEEMKKFDEKLFYVLDLHRDKKATYFWLFAVIFAVLMYTSFPIWPYEVKVGIWWVSYILLVAMVVLICVRLVLFIFFYIFGIDLWLFPNLFDEKLGILDSFKPFFSVNKRHETTITILIRVAISSVVLYLAWNVYEDPALVTDFFNHLGELYSDVFEWGKDKVVSYGVKTIY